MDSGFFHYILYRLRPDEAPPGALHEHIQEIVQAMHMPSDPALDIFGAGKLRPAG